MTAIVSDVFMDRVLPLIIARASFSAMHPLEWGALELVVLGVLTQVGLEFYRHGVPLAFRSWKHLPSRGKPLDVLAPRDRQFIAFSQVAIIVMTFHYLQFMASSPNVLWMPEQARHAPTHARRVHAFALALAPAVTAPTSALLLPRRCL